MPTAAFPTHLTTFVGRAAEVTAVAQRLATCRLLTVTGPGGVGKTRLALVVAASLDRARFVDLSAVAEPEGVEAALGAAVTWDELHSGACLLVLDNCEHVAPACASVVSALLAECAQVRVLATSRVPLGVDGEATVRLAPLGLDDSVRLFADRARLCRDDFAVDDTSRTDVVRLCSELDGLPLALELAAARTAAMTPGEIADRLQDHVALLARRGGGAHDRQRSLAATLEWSYDLLTPMERTLLCRLSVFAPGFTLDAAEQVCSGRGLVPGDVVDVLSVLVDQSLVHREGGGTSSRYRLLETVRRFANERLLLPDSGSSDAQACVFRPEGDYWAVGDAAKPHRLKDSRGLRVLHVLLSRPGTEIHALDPSISDASDTGDAGTVLDPEARAAYRRRLAELEEEIDESKTWDDPARAERAERERDELVRHLSAAVGIGGRSRRASAASERARVAATRSVKLAIGRIEQHDPSLGTYLRSTVRTGTFLSYAPDTFRPVRFVVTP